jgi:hypothetical protein
VTVETADGREIGRYGFRMRDDLRAGEALTLETTRR